jgi:exodeoxyribonuclease VII large subunit
MATKTEGLVVKDHVYTVTQVTEIVKAALETAFPQVWIEGEVSGYKKAASGHVFFSLKDDRSVIKAVMWQSTARKIAFDLKDGLKVVCRGKISVYEPRGDYQLYVDLVEPKGKGALQLAFEQLKEKLRAEGLFEEKRKRKLPLRPKTIGVVTSPTGAAIRDILRVLERRYAKLHVVIYPARVQGEGAAAEIVEGIDALGAWPGLDVLIVGRGGGSIEDLWAFNEEPVARAIARSPVPVISAVGHEVDFTIADFVASANAFASASRTSGRTSTNWPGTASSRTSRSGWPTWPAGWTISRRAAGTSCGRSARPSRSRKAPPCSPPNGSPTSCAGPWEITGRPGSGCRPASTP